MICVLCYCFIYYRHDSNLLGLYLNNVSYFLSFSLLLLILGTYKGSCQFYHSLLYTDKYKYSL
uniref:UORF1 n=1 Tax=Medicago truncatula TaxID=3880 RepID=A4ZVU8_MEDTR|nr:uORF1 [Medicago truncatula]